MTKKKPKHRFTPSGTKKPRISTPEEQLFKWRTDYADLADHGWGWGTISIRDFFKGMAKKLHEFDGWSWARLVSEDIAHFFNPSDIADTAQIRLRELVNENVVPEELLGEELTGIRYTGRARIWGFKVRGCFYLLWWDPKHTVYPVSKKHT